MGGGQRSIKCLTFFINIVKKILNWADALGIHYANKHEKYMIKRQTPFSVSCMQETLFMEPGLRKLHFYIHVTSTAYFSIVLNVGSAYLREHHNAI